MARLCRPSRRRPLPPRPFPPGLHFRGAKGELALSAQEHIMHAAFIPAPELRLPVPPMSVPVKPPKDCGMGPPPAPLRDSSPVWRQGGSVLLLRRPPQGAREQTELDGGSVAHVQFKCWKKPGDAPFTRRALDAGGAATVRYRGPVIRTAAAERGQCSDGQWKQRRRAVAGRQERPAAKPKGCLFRQLPLAPQAVQAPASLPSRPPEGAAWLTLGSPRPSLGCPTLWFLCGSLLGVASRE